MKASKKFAMAIMAFGACATLSIPSTAFAQETLRKVEKPKVILQGTGSHSNAATLAGSSREAVALASSLTENFGGAEAGSEGMLKSLMAIVSMMGNGQPLENLNPLDALSIVGGSDAATQILNGEATNRHFMASDISDTNIAAAKSLMSALFGDKCRKTLGQELKDPMKLEKVCGCMTNKINDTLINKEKLSSMMNKIAPVTNSRAEMTSRLKDDTSGMQGMMEECMRIYGK